MVKPIGISTDLVASTNIDSASVFSVINTNNIPVKLDLIGSSSFDIILDAGERITVEKEYASNVIAKQINGQSVSASTVWAVKVAYTN